MIDPKREVFVLERRGVPTRVEREKGFLLQQLEAGVRLGIPVGEEEIVRYVPEPTSSGSVCPHVFCSECARAALLGYDFEGDPDAPKAGT